MREITIVGGYDKNGIQESFGKLTLNCGDMYAVVGNTGSGKSRLIKDIEQFALGDSVSGRKILLDGKQVQLEHRNQQSMSLISHLGQNMRFVMDNTVEEFLNLHQKCRKQSNFSVQDAIGVANSITPEHIIPEQNLNSLSGGQTRALMVADIACICNSPIVLIDEIENAGIDKTVAFEALADKDKLVIVVTHDPHTALMADGRIIMENGAIKSVLIRSEEERLLLDELEITYKKQHHLQQLLRKAERLEWKK